ncbi:hypothetical protein [Catellatospora sp. NPDC049609]|uniref:hypothetical protein n=1 Tax=Catellatospora sp. NPDC049609 TaxID=3155505 RepID=UPI003422D256
MASLKPSQKAFLMLLMAEAREVSNSELLERYGVSITGADSRALVDAKLATKRKGAKGALVHELTDEGWVRCKQELTEPYAKGPGPAYPALHALLGAVDRHLQRNGLALADMFTASTPPPAPQPAAARPKPVVKRGLEKRLLAAYDKLSDMPNAWVSLTDLRAELTGDSIADVNHVLMKMAVARTIVLVPEENQKTLTAEDHAAAIHIGGEDKHLISIEAAA